MFFPLNYLQKPTHLNLIVSSLSTMSSIHSQPWCCTSKFAKEQQNQHSLSCQLSCERCGVSKLVALDIPALDIIHLQARSTTLERHFVLFLLHEVDIQIATSICFAKFIIFCPSLFLLLILYLLIIISSLPFFSSLACPSGCPPIITLSFPGVLCVTSSSLLYKFFFSPKILRLCLLIRNFEQFTVVPFG